MKNLKLELLEAKKIYRQAIVANDKMLKLEKDIGGAILFRNKFFDSDGNRVLDPARDYRIERYVDIDGIGINDFEEAFDKYCKLMHELRTSLGHDFPDSNTTFTHKTSEEKIKTEEELLEFAFIIDKKNGNAVFKGDRKTFEKMKKHSKIRKQMVELTLGLQV